MATNPFAAFAGAAAMPATMPQPALPTSPADYALQPGLMTGGGLLDGFVAQAPAVAPAPTPAIDKLTPGSDVHGEVLRKLDAALKFSRDEMKKHYSRWNFNELKIQAYTGMQDYEQLMGSLNRGTEPPQLGSVVVPYTYATIHAAATFVATVLLGRKPVFPLLATRGTAVERGRGMEAAIQSHLDASRGYETLWQGIWDSFVYGFGPKRLTWETRRGNSIRWNAGVRSYSEELTFAGNVLSAVDPYAYFPDPRVSISKCNVEGDFIFTEMKLSETTLRSMETAQQLKFVDEAIRKAKGRRVEVVADSRRRVRLGIGAGELLPTPSNVVGFQKVVEGTVRLVPKDWKLGDGKDAELWKFMWVEGGQIMQAEPLGMMHNQHPYVAPEPTSFGHEFMSLSMADMIGNFQDILSWLVSSRIENVRASVQNTFAVDPSRIDINDIRSNVIGRLIRLKQTAMGLPVKEAIQQIITQDVTMGNLTDMQNMRILADTITGVNDNMRGIQTAGGRRSATEARIAMQNGGGRLSQHAVRISSQAYHPMVEQMISNIQQFMPDEMWVEVTGDDGQLDSRKMTPDMLVGSFNFQISDGTLPFDKQALVEVWKEIMLGVAQDPELRQGWDLNEIFRYTADLGGAKNIDSFRRQPPPQVQTAAMADPGSDPNLQALGPAMPTQPLMLGSGFQG
jgi:hypothetical protein